MRDVWSVIGLAVIGLFRSRASLQAEILTLRHQLNLLRRKSPQRLTFISIDRLVFAGLYRLAPSVPSRRRLFSRPRRSRPLPIAATSAASAPIRTPPLDPINQPQQKLSLRMRWGSPSVLVYA